MYKQSPSDKLSFKLTPAIRKLEDFNIRMLGTQTQLLRIATTTGDLMGDTSESLKSQVINNAIVQHPWASNVQLFNTIDEATQQTNASAINLWDVLPISIKFPFEGNHGEDPIHLQKGDLLVECLFDEHGSQIPMIMEVTRLYAGTFIKEIITKKVEACLWRGTMSSEMKSAIDIYLQSIKR